jgi:RNA polymerase sigma-70 factor, ECF subfamily
VPLPDGRVNASSGDGPGEARAELTAALRRRADEGRRAWPRFAVEERGFLDYVSACLPHDGDPADALARLHVADLYLAFACAGRDAHALAVFERERMRPVVARALRRRPDCDAEGLMQQLRMTLLVGTAASAPTLLQYRGRAPLKAWLSVCATRLVVRARDATPGWAALDDNLEAPLATGGELGCLKGRYRESFNAAFRDALVGLAPRDRALLHQQYGLEMGIDRLGTVYGVSRATAARWVARARERLVGAVRARLVDELGLEGDEIDSILRSIRSAIELTLSRVAPSGDVTG